MASNRSRPTPIDRLMRATAALRAAHRDLEIAATDCGDDPAARLDREAHAAAGLWTASATLGELLAESGLASSSARPAIEAELRALIRARRAP